MDNLSIDEIERLLSGSAKGSSRKHKYGKTFKAWVANTYRYTDQATFAALRKISNGVIKLHPPQVRNWQAESAEVVIPEDYRSQLLEVLKAGNQEALEAFLTQ
jgi:hypothetical protein